MKKLNIIEAIYLAVDETDQSAMKYLIQMMSWARYIEKEIGSFYGYPVKAKAITMNGCLMDLPDDCYRPLTILGGNYEDECNAQYLDLGLMVVNEDIRDDEVSYIWMPMNSTQVIAKWWTQVGDKLNLIQKYQDQELTLVYQYIETNEKGEWIVNESHIRAIADYIIYKLASKSNWNVFKSEKLLRSGHMQFVADLENKYSKSVRHARGLDSEDNAYEKDTLK